MSNLAGLGRRRDGTLSHRILSLGAGVQSSTLALLLSRKHEGLAQLGFEAPDLAIFADTGWEPDYIYEQLDWLEGELTFPVERVQAGNLKEDLLAGKSVEGTDFMEVPLYTKGESGKRESMLRRGCTKKYKINPIHRRACALAGITRGRRSPTSKYVEMYIGISLDEVNRIKPARVGWLTHRWPLVELGWDRKRCLTWFNEHYPNRTLGRSACVICPYHTSKEWLTLKEVEPTSFAEAVSFDHGLRGDLNISKRLRHKTYLHVSLKPLDEAVAVEGQEETLDLFQNECEGMCGV